ncbi:MAG: hypothetical protein KDE54_06390, partial [Caldilineaceae bacterium]|nr:hypothetical protein [Caldilineaceae bacterium]
MKQNLRSKLSLLTALLAVLLLAACGSNGAATEAPENQAAVQATAEQTAAAAEGADAETTPE